jgi:hypothetical protein
MYTFFHISRFFSICSVSMASSCHPKGINISPSPGYELQAVLRKDGCDLCEQGRQLRAMASHDVLAASRVAGPLRLCFQSPFAKLPKFSEKQLANRFGFGKVREQHFHRLVFELQFAWMVPC